MTTEDASDSSQSPDRLHAARAFVAGIPGATADEKEAFAAYCAEAAVGRRRLKRSLFESFLVTYRRRALNEERRERAQRFISTYAGLLAETPLATEDDALLIRRSTQIAHRGVATEVRAEPHRRIVDLDVTDAALDDPEAATELLQRTARELGVNADSVLGAAREAIVSLVDTVLGDAVLPWLGSEERARDRFLDLPQGLPAADAITNAERLRAEALGEASRAKQKHIETKLRGLVPDARLNGKTLHTRYRELFQFFSGSLTADLVVEKALTRIDIDALAAAVDAGADAAVAAVDELLDSARVTLLAKVGDQIDALARNVRRLPHIEHLTEDEIVRVVAPYYAGLDRALKKRRARHALVAVEERAREAKYAQDVVRLEEHRADYADPASYYPLARSLKRELVLYVGPTNSGKTWRALNDLASAGSGAYLAPLRLLALEGQEELEKRGKEASFLTGEERDIRPKAKFVSSTIEMLSYDMQVDAVVIDEVQLLADQRRGWAWLAAVLGAPAQRVIMTGSPDCVAMVQSIADYLGEPLEIHECKRYNELRVSDFPKRLRDVEPGTAVVAFSRRDVLRLKEQLEAMSDCRVAVVYGNLSPQVRREEARRFRAGEADVLVATDAIAMGLNLPIREVVFYATEKFDGEGVRELSASEIRQIAGRAGRYGFAQYGVASALTGHGTDLIRASVRGHGEMLKPPYYVAPGPNHVRIIGKVLETDSLERILTFFERAIEFSDQRFDRSNIDELSFLSTFVDRELPNLPLTERLTIASAPVDIKSELVLGWFLERMLPAFRAADDDPDAPERLALNRLFDDARRFEHEAAGSSDELRRAEDYLKALTVYAWLSYRYPEVFDRLDECEEKRELVNAFIERSLRREVIRRCVACSKKLPKGFSHRICDACHAQSRHRRTGFRERRRSAMG